MALIIDMATRESFNPETDNQIFLGKNDKDYLSIIKCWDPYWKYFQLLPQSKTVKDGERFEDIADKIVNGQIWILMCDDPLRKYKLINGVPEGVLNRVRTMMIEGKNYNSLDKYSKQEYQFFDQIFHKKYSLLEEHLRRIRRAPN
ncbi:MAG: hypothetical protein KKF68_00615 [Nanoarchaeota archaeon]|nr:hypothetical protein [Nanoarchaeota archaeon]